MAEESVENKEGDVGHHGSSSQVTSPRLLEIIGFIFANGNTCRVRDVICGQGGDIGCAELGIPVGNNLDINRMSDRDRFLLQVIRIIYILHN